MQTNNSFSSTKTDSDATINTKIVKKFLTTNWMINLESESRDCPSLKPRQEEREGQGRQVQVVRKKIQKWKESK